MSGALKKTKIRLKNRDLSWLAFNERVLQEASNPTVPLYERIKFLAIWSSNLDEFFRVRVASLRALRRLKKKTQKKLDIEPARLVKRLLKVAWLQQEEFGAIFRNRIKKELTKKGVIFSTETGLKKKEEEFARNAFRTTTLHLLSPRFLTEDESPPFLENKSLYLVVRLSEKERGRKNNPEQRALVEIPANTVPRFFSFPSDSGRLHVMFLDDLIRLCLDEVFPRYTILGSHSIKLTRDAELELGDEFSGDLLAKVKKAVMKRNEGVPARFLYDTEMPKTLLRFLRNYFQLSDDDLVPGSRYHNFNDFFSLPKPNAPDLLYRPLPQLMIGRTRQTMFEQIQQGDMLAHFPYHSYECVLKFLGEAADDSSVRAIKITLYRVARNSKVVEHLLRAAKQGKEVTVFVEVKARFDEESNIFWAEEMERAGVRVLYSIPNLKVHAKLCLVERQEGDTLVRYAYLSTGNFNESVAAVYTDFGFFTADVRLTKETGKVFQVLCREKSNAACDHLLVSPFALRKRFGGLIKREIKHARKGREAFIIAKMNSLEDPKMIEKLYEASNAGVKIRLIIRGICCLIPGVKGMSENIEVVSIVDRFLEHARVFVFHNGGNELCYLSSADWMKRNLDRRIEVAFPVYDSTLQKHIRAILDLQLHDNVKARIVDKKLKNLIQTGRIDESVRSQLASHEYWKAAAGHRDTVGT